MRDLTRPISRLASAGGCKRLAGEGERGAANIPKSPGYCWSTPTYRNWCAQHASFEGTKAEQTSPRKSTPRTLKGLTNSIRPFLRQAGAPGYRSSLGVEQPMPEICVRLAPLPRVFRQSVRCWSSIGAPIRRIKSGWKVLGEAGTCASRFFAPLLPAALLTRSPRGSVWVSSPVPRADVFDIFPVLVILGLKFRDTVLIPGNP